MFLPVAQVIPIKKQIKILYEIKQLNQCLNPLNFTLRASTPFMASEARREGRSPFFPAPPTRVSFRVLLSRDFSWLPQMESLLAGYLNFDNFLFGPPKQRLYNSVPFKCEVMTKVAEV